MSSLLSPRGYQMRAIAPEAHAGSFNEHTFSKRTAIRTVRKKTLALGVGARGEVLGGPKLDSAVYQVRVGRDNAGKPKLIVEEL